MNEQERERWRQVSYDEAVRVFSYPPDVESVLLGIATQAAWIRDGCPRAPRPDAPADELQYTEDTEAERAQQWRLLEPERRAWAEIQTVALDYFERYRTYDPVTRTCWPVGRRLSDVEATR